MSIRAKQIEIDEDLSFEGQAATQLRAVILKALAAGTPAEAMAILFADGAFKFGGKIEADDATLGGKTVSKIVSDALDAHVSATGLIPTLSTGANLSSASPLVALTLPVGFKEGWCTAVNFLAGADIEFKVWNSPTGRAASNLLFHTGSPDRNQANEVDAVPWYISGVEATPKLYVEILNGTGIQLSFAISRVK